MSHFLMLAWNINIFSLRKLWNVSSAESQQTLLCSCTRTQKALIVPNSSRYMSQWPLPDWTDFNKTLCSGFFFNHTWGSRRPGQLISSCHSSGLPVKDDLSVQLRGASLARHHIGRRMREMAGRWTQETLSSAYGGAYFINSLRSMKAS